MASYFQNLEVWKKSFTLAKNMYLFTKDFPKEEQFSLTDQMRRASVSVVSNIAEWSGMGTNQEYIRFLHIAKGSAMELETQLLLARELWYLDSEKFEIQQSILDEILKMINSLIKKLES